MPEWMHIVSASTFLKSLENVIFISLHFPSAVPTNRFVFVPIHRRRQSHGRCSVRSSPSLILFHALVPSSVLYPTSIFIIPCNIRLGTGVDKVWVVLKGLWRHLSFCDAFQVIRKLFEMFFISFIFLFLFFSKIQSSLCKSMCCFHRIKFFLTSQPFRIWKVAIPSMKIVGQQVS